MHDLLLPRAGNNRGGVCDGGGGGGEQRPPNPYSRQRLQFKSYRMRWHMLGIFCLQSMMNAFLWICFAPIDDSTARYYQLFKRDGVTTDTGLVNLLSVTFLVLYLPGSILASYIMSRYGLRRVVVVGAVLNALSALVRLASVPIVEYGGSPHLAFSVLIFGQCFSGLAQPLFVNAPAKIAADFFGLNERDVAVTVAALFNPIGNALGQALPPTMVTAAAGDDGDLHVDGMPALLLLQAALNVTACVWAVVCFIDRPPSPPSRSASCRDILKAERSPRTQTRTPSGNYKTESVSIGDTLRELLDETRVLVGNRQFRFLIVAFGVGLGLFNAVLTVIAQLVRPAGYDASDAGNFGAVLMGCGLVGAGLAGAVMDATHEYRRLLKGGFGLTFLSTLLFGSVLKPANLTPVTVAFALMGFFMLPMLPVTLENAVECTYPISEEHSTGVLFVIGNLLGMAFTFSLDALINLEPTVSDDADFAQVWSPATLFIAGTLAFCFLALLPYDGEYLRLQAEEHDHHNDSGGEASSDDDDESEADVAAFGESLRDAV